MPFYCMCPSSAKNKVVDVEDKVPTKVQVYTRMEFVKAGVEQVLDDGSRHYPNVDAFECPDCHRIIIRE